MHETSTVNLAVVQFKPVKGDYARSLAKVGETLTRIIMRRGDNTPNLVIFPESALSGYFLEGGVREVAVSAERLAQDLASEYRKTGAEAPLDIAIGFYEEWQNTLYNSALYVTVGGSEPIIRHVHRKVFLPTYGVFDEERFVEPGHEIRAFDTPWGRAALLVCEDAWHSLSGTLAALDGAQIVIIPSASPARGIAPAKDEEENSPRMPANLRTWERIAWGIAVEHGLFTVVAQLIGSEGGKMFSGGSTVTNPGGEIVSRGPLWEETVLYTEINLNDITRTRADAPMLSDLRAMLPYLVKNLKDSVKD